MKALQPLDTSGSTHPMTKCHIPQDFHLQQHGHENCKFIIKPGPKNPEHIFTQHYLLSKPPGL